MHAPFAYCRKRLQKMPFTPSKPSAQSVKGIFFYNDSIRFEK